MVESIDINCDLGESYGRYQLGQDQEVLKLITSANIACGFHAGDPKVMYETVKLAHENRVAIGAHPGFPDLNGFGRRKMELSYDEIYQLIIYQLGALEGFARLFGERVTHLKPHGALYNQAAQDNEIARAIVQAIADVDQDIILFGLAGSELIKEGQNKGIKVAQEVFADRTYLKDGSLTPRSREDALIHDSDLAIKRVIKMVKDSKVETVDGEEISIQADTICVHGDNQQALQFVMSLRQGLEREGITIGKVGEIKWGESR